MKFFNLAVVALTAASSVAAAPNAKKNITKEDLQQLETKSAPLQTKVDTSQTNIDCNQDDMTCSITCNGGFQTVCSLVALVDSLFYGLENIIGFNFDCDEKGCNVDCPGDATALCAVDDLGAAINAIATVGEGIILNGVQGILGGLFPFP